VLSISALNGAAGRAKVYAVMSRGVKFLKLLLYFLQTSSNLCASCGILSTPVSIGLNAPILMPFLPRCSSRATEA